MTGVPYRDGLGGPEGLEPHSRLPAARAIPNAELTELQINALIAAALYLDFQAGEGMGARPEGCTDILWADDIILTLATAFDIEWGDDFGAAVRARLTGKAGARP